MVSDAARNFFSCQLSITNPDLLESMTEVQTITKVTKSTRAVLAEAKKLFWKYGIKKVSVEEICAQAGVSKMTFYRYFSNKEEVAVHVLRKIFEVSRTESRRLMDDANLPLPVKIAELIKSKRKHSEGVSREFLRDAYGDNFPTVKAFIIRFRKIMTADLERSIRKMQSEGVIRKDLKIGFVTQMIDLMQEKAADEDLQDLYDTNTELITELMQFFFYGIAGKEAQTEQN